MMSRYVHRPLMIAASLAIWGFSIPATAEDLVAAGAIAKNPSQYAGKQVKVKAEVERVFGRQYFTLDEDRILAGPDVLVLIPYPGTSTVEGGKTFTVTGTVRPYVSTDLRRAYNWFQPTPEIELSIKSRPVIVATSVLALNGTELAGKAPAGDAQTAAGTPTQPQAVTAEKIAETPTTYHGTQVRVQAKVEDVLDPRVFTLEGAQAPSGPDVLVLAPQPPASAVKEGTTVTVTGTVRPFVRGEIERDFDWFRMAPETEVTLRSRPVVVASSIRTGDGKELLGPGR